MKILNYHLLSLLMGLFTVCFQTAFSQTINCNSVSCIQNAMANAQPGTEIVIASGTYNFSFNDKIPGAFERNAYLYSGQDGNSSNRIILRGENPDRRPVIKGVDYEDGYLLGLEGDYWTIKDIEFMTGSKGVILDDADYTELINLEIHDVGEEALHFRHGTSFCTADGLFIHNTGRTTSKSDFGEGVYIGSDRSVHNAEYNAEGNEDYCAKWKRDQGRCGQFYNPNVSHITVKNSTIGPNITAEHFDVREGSCQIFIENNRMDGEGQILKDFQDSFIDLKGSFCYVRNNTFFQNGQNSLTKGVQVIDRDDKVGLLLESATENVISDNEFIMNDTDTPILTFFDKRGVKNYAYNNTRTPSGTIFKSGSDFQKGQEPQNRNPNCAEDDLNSQFSELTPKPAAEPVLSIGEVTKNSKQFIISPNPTSDFITIQGLENIKEVTVYNMIGQEMNVEYLKDASKVIVSNLASGSYILLLKTDTSASSKVFAVTR